MGIENDTKAMMAGYRERIALVTEQAERVKR